jgi:hypothetical protein
MGVAYVKVERGEQLEPGDVVFEVVRFGVRVEDVKYNEMRVMSVERGAVRAVHLNKPGSRSVKLAFHALAIRIPDRPPLLADNVRKLPPPPPTLADAPPPTLADAPPPPPSLSASASFAAYVDLTTGVLDEARVELRNVSDSRARVIAEMDPISQAHRKQVEALEAKIQEARETFERTRKVSVAALAALDAKRAELDARILALEGMLKAVSR